MQAVLTLSLLQPHGSAGLDKRDNQHVLHRPKLGRWVIVSENSSGMFCLHHNGKATHTHTQTERERQREREKEWCVCVCSLVV